MSIYERLTHHHGARTELAKEREKDFYRLMWKVFVTTAGLFCFELLLLAWLIIRRG